MLRGQLSRSVPYFTCLLDTARRHLAFLAYCYRYESGGTLVPHADVSPAYISTKLTELYRQYVALKDEDDRLFELSSQDSPCSTDSRPSPPLHRIQAVELGPRPRVEPFQHLAP